MAFPKDNVIQASKISFLRKYYKIGKCIECNLKWENQNIWQYNSTLRMYMSVYMYTHIYISVIYTDVEKITEENKMLTMVIFAWWKFVDMYLLFYSLHILFSKLS